jgi:hypothetical protein
MMMEKLVELLAGEIEVLGENLPQCRFVHHKSHMLCPDANPGRRGGKPASNRLSYFTAKPTINHLSYVTVLSSLLSVSLEITLGSCLGK